MKCLVLVFGAALVAVAAAGSESAELDSKKRAECEMWSKLENKTLPLQNQGHANCTTNADCTGFSCSGIYQGKDISFGMRALPCKTPPGVEIFGYAPQYNTQHFSHIFTHKAEYQVPGALLNISMLPSDGVKPGAESLIKGILEVHLKMNHDTNTLTMGLNAKACVNRTCIFNKPVFNNTQIPVPDCPNAIPTLAPDDEDAGAGSECLVSDIQACGAHMACVQDEAGSPRGVCSCLPGFSVQDDRTCISIQEEEIKAEQADSSDEDGQARPKKSAAPVPASVELPRHVTSLNEPPQLVRTGHERRHDGGESEEARRGGSGAIAGVVISLLAVFVVGGVAVGLLMRTSAGARLRARLNAGRGVPYGDIVIPSAANPATSSGVTQLGSTQTLDSNFA